MSGEAIVIGVLGVALVLSLFWNMLQDGRINDLERYIGSKRWSDPPKGKDRGG